MSHFLRVRDVVFSVMNHFVSFIMKNWVKLTSSNPLQNLPAGLKKLFCGKDEDVCCWGDVDNELVVQAI